MCSSTGQRIKRIVSLLYAHTPDFANFLQYLPSNLLPSPYPPPPSPVSNQHQSPADHWHTLPFPRPPMPENQANTVPSSYPTFSPPQSTLPIFLPVCPPQVNFTSIPHATLSRPLREKHLISSLSPLSQRTRLAPPNPLPQILEYFPATHIRADAYPLSTDPG